MKLRNWLKSRLTEPSTHAGVAGFLSGIGFILNHDYQTGIPAVIFSIIAIAKKDNSTPTNNNNQVK